MPTFATLPACLKLRRNQQDQLPPVRLHTGEFVALLSSNAAEPRVKLVVVVKKANPISELSMRDLRRLFTGEHMTDPAG